MIDIQYFITFREVARSLNLTRAAERLGYSQPSVSLHIQNIEKRFRIKLLERSGKRLKLTDDGVKMLQYADRIVEAFQEADGRFQENETIHLKIGAIESLAAFFLPRYFQQLRQKYPSVNITIIPLYQGEIVEKVKNGELDIGIILDSPITDSELRTIRIKHEELIVICPIGHSLEKKQEILLQDLQNCDLILTEKECTYRAAIETSLKENHIPFQIVSELGSIEAVKQCVIYGMGVALIPKIAVMDELNKGLLSGVSLREGILPSYYTQIVIHQNKYTPEPIKYFISALSQTMVE